MLKSPTTDVRIRLASGINLLSGLWLFLSPWALTSVASDRNASLSNMVIGCVMFVLGITRVSLPRRAPTLSGINFALGFWTLISPWVFGFTMDSTRVWSSVLIGGLVMLCAAWSTTMTVQLQRGHLA
jgi:SPW repeat